MALTRPSFTQLNTTTTVFSDPITVLNQGSTSANVDVGFLFNRANGLVSNVALYWSEATQSFVTAYTNATGVTNANVTAISFANVRTGNITANGFFWSNGTVFSSGSTFTGGYVQNTIIAAANLVANSGTASSSNVTGAVVVSGGIGVSGSINVGSNLVFSNTSNPGISKPLVTRMDLNNSGGLDANGPFWSGYHFNAPDGIVVNGATGYPRMSFYWNYNSVTNPNNINFNMVAGNNATGGNANVTLGTDTAGYVRFLTNNTERLKIGGEGNVVATATTTSASTTTGALVVAGGVGIAGALYIANTGDVSANIGSLLANAGSQATSINTINANLGTATTNISTIQANLGSYQNTTNANIGTLFLGNASTQANLGAFEAYANTKIGTNTNSNLVVVATTTSTSTTTGALVVAGGVGIAGALYVGGATQAAAITSSGTIIASTINAGTIGNSGATLTGTVGTAAQNSITTMTGLTGFGTASVVTTAAGHLTVTGNLTVNGTQNIINNTIYETTEYVVTQNATFGNVSNSLYAGSLNTANAVITGGSINNATVGATTHTTGRFTTVTATTVNAGTIGNASAVFSGASATLTGTIIASTVNAGTIGNAGATLTGTLSSGAQNNITSATGITALGTIASLAATTAVATNFSSGNIVFTNATSGTVSTANVSLYESVTATTTDATHYPMLSGTATGNTASFTASGLVYNPSTGNLVLAGTTTSTSTTTGALVVKGGAAIAGNLNVGGVFNTFSGNIGIGTTTQSGYKLDVSQSTNDTTIRSITTGAGAWLMTYDSTAYYSGVKHVGNNGARFWTTGMTNNSQTYTIAMDATGTTNRFFTIDTTGNIVISATTTSTSTTTGALVVKGGVGIAGNLNTGSTSINASLVGGTTSQLQINGDVTIAGANRSVLGNMFYQGGWKYAANGAAWGFREDNTGNLQVITAPVNSSGALAAASPIYPITLNLTTGNLGIGTSMTSPDALLHVKDGTNAIYFEPTGNWAGKIFNATDAANEHGLVVGQRWAAAASTAFEVGSTYGGGAGSWRSYFKIDGLGGATLSSGGSERIIMSSSTGNLVINATTASTSTTTGALVVKGGVGIAGQVTASNIMTTSGVYWANGAAYSSGSGGGITYTASNTAPASPSAGNFWYEPATDIKYQYINDGTSSYWVDQSYPTSFGNLTVANTLTVGGSIVGTTTNANYAGAANVSLYESVTATTTNATHYPILSGITTGNTAGFTASSLTFNPSTGALGATTLAGTLTTAAQTNITSVGSLTALTINTANTAVDGAHVYSVNAATVSQLTLHATSGTVNRQSKLKFTGTFFNTPGDVGERYTTSIRSGFDSTSNAWGSEFLGIYVNSTTNDGNTDANQTLIADFSNYGGLKTYSNLVATNGSLYSRNLLLQGDGTNAYIRPRNAGSSLYLGAADGNYLQVTATQSIFTGNVNPTGNLAYNLGTPTAWWNNVYGVSVQAKYADLAEHYTADDLYGPGTVVVFGGAKEITVSNISHDPRVAGVISTNPAYLMNAANAGLPVALTGRVPCQVQGPVAKGDRLVNIRSGVAGRLDPVLHQYGCIIGKSLGEIPDDSVQTIEIVVGRF